jgi:CheY-like chemotaxis protein
MSDPPLVLLVEDERQIRRFVRTALEGESWVVHEAATLQQGLAEAGTRKPDLIILDLGLPDGDGMDRSHSAAAYPDRNGRRLPIGTAAKKLRHGSRYPALPGNRAN